MIYDVSDVVLEVFKKTLKKYININYIHINENLFLEIVVIPLFLLKS